MIPEGKYVVLFDGVCNFCNSSVNFIMKRDKRGQILFASLQSDEGVALMNHFGKDPEDLYSIILVQQNKVYDRSTAALRIALLLGGLWPLLGRLGLLFPSGFRNWVYSWIAKNRYKWFGKKEACRLPTPEERNRFFSVAASS